MNAIDLMIKEHEHITSMIKIIREACYKVVCSEEIEYDDIYLMIDFIKNYADKHHHGKEEVFLFNRMIDEIGSTAEKLVKHGMLVEHDLGRLYISDLEKALEELKEGNNKAKLDVIGSAISYCNLLTRHIEKENKVAYTFANRMLKDETKEIIDNENRVFEEENKMNSDKYLKILEDLKIKYDIEE